MGFEATLVVEALKHANNDAAVAIEMIHNNPELLTLAVEEHKKENTKKVKKDAIKQVRVPIHWGGLNNHECQMICNSLQKLSQRGPLSFLWQQSQSHRCDPSNVNPVTMERTCRIWDFSCKARLVVNRHASSFSASWKRWGLMKKQSKLVSTTFPGKPTRRSSIWQVGLERYLPNGLRLSEKLMYGEYDILYLMCWYSYRELSCTLLGCAIMFSASLPPVQCMYCSGHVLLDWAMGEMIPILMGGWSWAHHLLIRPEHSTVRSAWNSWTERRHSLLFQSGEGSSRYTEDELALMHDVAQDVTEKEDEYLDITLDEEISLIEQYRAMLTSMTHQ